MTRILPLLLFFCSAGLSLGQGGNVLSLQKELESTTGEERVQVLNRLSKELKFRQAERAAGYAEEAYELSADIGFAEGLATSSFHLSIYERDQGNYRRAARLAEEGAEAARGAGKPILELEGWKILIGVYRLSRRNKKLAEAELEYQKLENQLGLEKKTAQLMELQEEYASSESALRRSQKEKYGLEEALSLSEEEKLRQEAELAELAREKAELEVKALELENETVKNALEISEKEKQILEYDARLRRQQFWLSLLVAGLLAAALIAILIIRNYRLKKAKAEEKARLQRQLMMQEKMASLGQLTAGIAHEIKNPLNFITNFAEGSASLLEELQEEAEKYQPQIGEAAFVNFSEIIQDLKLNAKDIRDSGVRADRIVRSMMDHARGEQGTRQPVHLNELAEENINLAYHGFRATHSSFYLNIEKKLDPTLLPLNGFQQNLSRVLLNIFNNACYAVHQKKQEIGNDYTPSITISSRQQGDMIELHIRDNGTGIPPEVQQKIFEPFFTTKPSGAGHTGLGLSISHEIISQQHQGSLEVQSEPGEYTEFVIRLPV